jgi:hypothetical protein
MAILKIDDSTLEKFYQNNPDFDINHFDFLNPEAVDSLKLDKSGKDATLQKLMAYQRLLRIAPTPEAAAVLYENSMDSARKITAVSQSQFVKQFAPKLEGGAKAAKQVYQSANVLKTQAMHLWANVNHLKKSPYYMSMTAAPAPQSVTETFENLSSYKDIFDYGTLNYCDCPECKSILGPAAYLVDLLRLIDKAITVPNTRHEKPGDSIPAGLTFNDRRPDISKIKLTCGNTNDLVPYLQIVNEILEKTLTKSLGPYVYKALTNIFYPFNLPFNLPLTQIRTYLAQNNTSLSEIYQAMDKAPDASLSIAAAREYLNISQEELVNLEEQTVAQLPTVLTNNYGVTVTASNLAGLNKVDTYVSQTGISLNDLHELLYQNLSPEEIFNVSGVYTQTTNGDVIVFTQNGDSVSAHYPNRGTVTVSGSIINNVVQGTWENDSGAGYCEFTFSPDCSSFTGKWNAGMGQPWESTAWNGTRKTGTDRATKKPYPAAAGGIIPHNLFINKAFKNNTDYLSIQLNATDPKDAFNEIAKLDIKSLDTLNRFIRLSQKLGWTYAELDWMLLTVSSLVNPTSRNITDDAFRELAKIKQLEDDYSLPRDLLAALWYDIKTTGIGTGQFSEAPFDKIFNSPERISSTGSLPYRPAYPPGYTRFANPLYQREVEQWALNKAAAAGSDANIIVAGIPASTDSVRLIATSVFVNQDSIDLTVENLSILYRHAMLAKELNMRVEEYLLLLNLLGITNQANPDCISPSLTPDQVLLIVKTLKWIRASGLNAFAINYICYGTEGQYVNSGYDKKNISSFIKSLKSAMQSALLKPVDFLGYGISQDASVAALTWLSSNEFVNKTGVVLNDKTLATSDLPIDLRWPDGITFRTFRLNSDQKNFIVSTVETFGQKQNKIFITQLASFFGVKGDSIAPIIEQVQILLDEPDYLEKFITPDTNFIVSFIKSVSRFLLFYKSLSLNNTQIDGIIKNPDAYNQIYTVDKKAFTITFQIDNIYEIYAFTQLEAAFDDRKNLLVSYLSNAGTADYETVLNELVAITGWNKDQTSYLLEYFWGKEKDKNCTTVSELSRLNRVFTITQELGIDVYFIAQLNEMASWTSAADNWEKYKSYSASLFQRVSANSSKEAWPSIFKKMNGSLEEAKRDAILNLTVWEVRKTYADITTPDNLYEFLLIDVKRGGCQDISYIKQALNSAQLYLQRCRLNLERNVVIDKQDLPDVYWEWIMNYRVWEANREVFLYPENYIDPSLRKSKTDLFKTLENDLSQGNVTDDTVQAAYTKYLDSFRELAALKYVDAYYCTVKSDETGDSETLFLFARTQSKPYKYYYITMQPKNVWSQWHEINITINSDFITPVYAFSKLFIFWVELSQSKESAADNSKTTITKAAIKSSFYDFSGNWKQPQTVMSEQIINVDNTDKNFTNPFLAAPFNVAFNKDMPYFNRVMALNVKADSMLEPEANILRIETNSQAAEKICLYYGPLVDVSLTPNAPPTIAPGVTADVYEFEKQIAVAYEEVFQVYNAYRKGFYPLFPQIVIGAELKPSFLTQKNEYIFLQNDNESADSAPGFEAIVSQNKLALSAAKNTLRVNYTEGMGLESIDFFGATPVVTESFVSFNIDSGLSQSIFTTLTASSILDPSGNVDNTVLTMPFAIFKQLFADIQVDDIQAREIRNTLFAHCCGNPVLLGNVSSDDSQIIPVGNQPGMFLFYNNGEGFLVRTKKYRNISDLLKISNLVNGVNKYSFITPNIAQKASEEIYRLISNPPNNILVDAGDVIIARATIPIIMSVANIPLSQAREVKNILLSSGPTELSYMSGEYTFVTPLSFVCSDPYIDENLSKVIYQFLSAPLYHYVSFNGIVNKVKVASLTPEKLLQMLSGYMSSVSQAKEVIKVLTTPNPGIEKSKFKITDNIYNLTFGIERITTGAIGKLSTTLFTEGLEQLLSLQSQQPPADVTSYFDQLAPAAAVTPPDVAFNEQVRFDGPYGNYYRELFFHGPLLVAEILNNNQQFQDAEKWLQYVFNPTLGPVKMTPESFRTGDITYDESQRIFTVLTTNDFIDADGCVSQAALNLSVPAIEALACVSNVQAHEIKNILGNNYQDSPTANYWRYNPFRNRTLKSLVEDLTNPRQITAYETDPFDPHAIAFLRIGAYEKAVVMKYIENLIDWGDSEFRLYTWESITAAQMLYVYASDLLGPRPQDVGPCRSEYPVDFSEILNNYPDRKSGIPEFLIDMENVISSSITPPPQPSYGKNVPFNDIEAYFCVPENDTFISIWDTVENRLYNIRHCLNINGVPQPLPLFEPPIDPMALVKAAASGNNLLNVAALTQPNIPAYRFSYMVEQAKSLTSTVIQLGNSLLSVLEKNDAEGLALLQSTNELNILNLTTLIKQQQIQELQNQLDALQQSLLSAQNRQQYYAQLMNDGLNVFEIADLALRKEALFRQNIALGINGVSIAGYLTPNIYGFSDGGMKFGEAVNMGAQMSSLSAEILNQTAGIVSTAGSYQRRQEDWQFQADSAAYDIAQITSQIDANKISIASSQQELIIHQKNIEQNQAVDSFLKSKFTNQELYQWLISRLSSLYFQTYNLAEAMALRAQAAYQFELDSSDQMIAFNYWDDLHKGLLAGESLMLSLQHMESAYVQNNTRRLEIEKTVSIRQNFPKEFLKFKWGNNGGTQGTLDFTLSEKLFDFDFPSHYCRKIKSISVSIPAVVGPYQNLNASLRQNSNMVVLSSDDDGVNAVEYAISKTVPNTQTSPPEPSSSVLRQNWVPDQAIAVSKGIDDSGMFVLDFNDQRYLPFEGTGAVSKWTLSLPPSTNRINFDSISDVIINIKYTAKDGGDDFAGKVKDIYLKKLPAPSGDYFKAKTFDLQQAFSEKWMQMFNTPPDADSRQSISFPVTDNFWLTNLSNVTVEKLMVLLEVSNKKSLPGSNFLLLEVGNNTQFFSVVDHLLEIDSADLQSVGFGVNSSICTLVFDVNKAPDSITKIVDNVKMLDETKLIDMAVVIVYTEKAFS